MVTSLSPVLDIEITFISKNFFVYLFIFERDRDSMSGGGTERDRERERQRERERIPSRLCAASTEPNTGLKLTKLQDHDLSRNRDS